MAIEQFPDNAQVWIYGADRFLNEAEEAFAQEQLNHFVGQWAAHGAELSAEGIIFHHNFIVIVSDESKVKASGCSIDSSVRFIKDLGKEINVDFFNRLKILIEKNGEFKRVHFNELANYSEWNMFDLTIKNLKDFKEKWVLPIRESQYIR